MSPHDRCTALLADLPEARLASMFGYPALCLGRKAFAFFHVDTGRHAAFRLPPKLKEAWLARDGVTTFTPAGGRPMRAWVAVPETEADAWPVLAKAALEHLAESLEALAGAPDTLADGNAR